MRPLDRLTSIKGKLSVLIVVAVTVAVVAIVFGWRTGLKPPARALIAMVFSLLMVQVVARGMTSPLREMAAAARAMAAGDYGRRVTATSRDEVGELARAFNRLAAELAGTDVQIEVDVLPPELEVVADVERVHQVLANLLDNAMRHSPPGGAVVVRARSGVGGAIDLEVTDQGPGIPSADAERVFERFFRTDASRSAAIGGTGLGLAIARGVLDLHGGSIRADRNTPNGCRMVVRLPRRTA